MIGEHFADKWSPNVPNNSGTTFVFPEVTKKEFEDLKKEVLEMKELLKKAVEYDKKNNEPHCEKEEKIEILRKVAEAVGVDLSDVLGKH